MTIFKSVDYNEKEVSAKAIDTNSGYFLWIAFKQDASGNCKLKKVSANDISQEYFDIDLAVDEITTLTVRGNYIFVGVDHTTNYMYRYALLNPLSTPTAFALPSGVTEAPIDSISGTTYLFWLFPGTVSGEVAKIVKTSAFGVFDETIELEQSGDQILNAKSLTEDTDEDLWVITNEEPANLARLHLTSAGIWDLTVTIMQ